jgi:ribosomal protein S18 acetylase RimI-like enzyme
VPTVDERAHNNFCNWTRWTAGLHPESAMLDESGMLALAGPIDFPSSRTAIRWDRSLTAEEWVDNVDAFLTARGKTACVHARVGADDDLAALLLERGFREWATTPEMVCEHALESRSAPSGVTVRMADSRADISAYAGVAAEAFAHLFLPKDATVAAIDHPDAFLAPDCVVALAEIDGEPVAGAQVLLLDGNRNGYVAWVSCTDAARGRGLGDTVTRAATNEAFARGAGLVSLEASQYGEHTYARMGYREIYRYRMLLRI